MLSKDYIIDKVVSLLPIDSETYAKQVDILVDGAMSKLKSEGVDSIYIEEDSSQALDYCVCVSYQVSMDIDADVDYERVMKQYVTRVNTLRTSLIV